MVARCANPKCSAEFRSLKQGKLFVREVSGKKTARGEACGKTLGHYWICEKCSQHMTIVPEGDGIKVVPLHPQAGHRKAS